ncbi:DUF433 domain-containing protein (plasmid) [Paracoccus versutus]|nr:DUF433 domain-containing protein [Paracoccus versutus]
MLCRSEVICIPTPAALSCVCEVGPFEKMTESVVQAFTEAQTARLTGVTVGQLRAWDRTDFYKPSIGHDRSIGRIYSFRDLLNLRVIGALRRDIGVSMQHLRSVGKQLREIADEDWAGVTLYVLNRRVVFDNPHTSAREEVVSGQGILGIPLEVVRGDMKSAVAKEFSRGQGQEGQIVKARRVVHAEPVIAGTRIMVKSILAFIQDGYDDDTIIAEYPSLTRADIAAVRAIDEAA